MPVVVCLKDCVSINRKRFTAQAGFTVNNYSAISGL